MLSLTLILSFVALVVIEVLSTFGNPSNAYVYLVIDKVMNIPRISGFEPVQVRGRAALKLGPKTTRIAFDSKF